MTNVVVLTGAGISRESGIPTFRDAGGLWESHRVEDVATPKAFRRDPDLVYRFYNERRERCAEAEPNAAHHALARLEAAWEGVGDFLLVTQNVDDLHERAGSTHVLHMHGKLNSARCGACRYRVAHHGPMDALTKCKACGKAALRPDVVWFGEKPLHVEAIEDELARVDLLIVVGTSGQVMPAALYPALAADNGRGPSIIEVNPEPTGNPCFTRVVRGPAVDTVPALVDQIVGKSGEGTG